MKFTSLEDILHAELAKLTNEAQHAQKATQNKIQTRIVFEGVMKVFQGERLIVILFSKLKQRIRKDNIVCLCLKRL